MFKVLLLALVAYLIWKGRHVLSFIWRVATYKPAPPPSEDTPTAPNGTLVQDMECCPVCGLYAASDAVVPCQRANCPRPSKKKS